MRNLFLVGMRRLKTARAGSMRMMMSEMMLNRQVTRTFILLSRHLASVISVSQMASRGEQAKVVTMVLMI